MNVRAALLLAMLGSGILPAATLDPIDVGGAGILILFEDHPTYTLTLTGISPATLGQRMKVLATFADDLQYPAPVIAYDGFAATATVSFRPYQDANWFDSGGSGALPLTITVADDDGTPAGGSDRISRVVDVWLYAVNDPPTIDRIDAVTLQEDESDSARLTFHLTGISAGPANEQRQWLTFFAASTAGLVTVESITYAQYDDEAWIRLRPLPDAHGSTTVLVTAIDDARGGGTPIAVTQAWYVEVAAVNDPPHIAVNGTSPAVAGGWTFIDAGHLLASDVDGDDPIFQLAQAPVLGTLLRFDTVLDAFVELAIGDTWSQGDIGAGRLAYRHDGTPVGPGTSSDAFSFTISDGIIPAPLGPSAHLLVLAADAAIPPAVELYATSPTWMEGDAALPVVPQAVVVDPDSVDFDGGRLLMTLAAGGGPDDRLAFLSQGLGAGQISIDGVQVSYGNRLIGIIRSPGLAGSPLDVGLQGADCTPAAVQALLRVLTFGSGDDPGSAVRTITVVVDDGDGGVSASAGVQVAVVPVEDPPILTITRVATPAWSSRVLALRSDDADGGAHLWSITAQPASAVLAPLDPAAGLFILTASGPGEESFTAQVGDGVNPPSQAVIRLTIDGGDGARPHPLADPPRLAVAGEELVFSLPFDTADLGAGALLDVAVTADAPAGVVLSALEAATVRVNWLVPADLLPGSYIRFGLVAADLAGRGATLVPLTLRIVAPPAGVD